MKKTREEISTLIAEMDQLLRLGRFQDVREKLQRGKWTKCSASDRLTISQFARRANLPYLTLKLLGPTIHPSRLGPTTASDEEKLEYAGALIKVHALGEAKRILETIDPLAHPRTYLYLTFAHVATWEYEQTIPLLKAYLESPKVSSFDKYPGRLNLAAALIYVKDYASAEKVLDDTLKPAMDEGAKIVCAHVRQLMGQSAVVQKNYPEARHQLALAKELYGGERTQDQFFVEKWQALCSLYESNGSAQSLILLQNIRQKARELNHPETIRDCDFHEVCVTNDTVLALKLYFGTRAQSYRDKLLAHFPQLGSLPESYELALAQTPPSIVYDLTAPTQRLSKHSLKLGRNTQRLLAFLASDIYVPVTGADICEHVFQEPHFHPVHTVHRVQQAILRLRRLCARLYPHLKIEVRGGAYRLTSERGVALRVPQQPYTEEGHIVFLNRLQTLCEGNTVTLTQASNLTGFDKWQVVRMLKSGCDDGLLVKRGGGRSTYYEFVQIGDNEKAA